MRADCAKFNENVLIGIEAGEPMGEKIGVRLIAGLIARRIVPWIAQNDIVQRGERISLIQFGSRVDVYLPKSAKIKVQLGDRVVGGETMLAELVLNEMETKPPLKPAAPPEGERLKIYFLPNLLTAGNLFCGFVALTKIVEANLTPDPLTGLVNWWPIKFALASILLACIFDLFDGRVARMGGHESPFGREFDSLADLISFGVAPAFLVHRVVLRQALPDEYARTRLVHRLDLSDLRRVPAGAFQLSVRDESAAARARIFSASRFRPRPAWWPR